MRRDGHRRTLLVTLGPFFAAEAVARQATISFSGDIDAWQKVGAGGKPVTFMGFLITY